MSQVLGGGGKQRVSGGGDGKSPLAWLTFACSAGGRWDKFSFPGLGGAGGPLPGLLLPGEDGGGAAGCCPNLLSRFLLDSRYDGDASGLELFLCGVGGGFLMLPGGDFLSGDPEFPDGRGGGGGVTEKPELSEGGGGNSGECCPPGCHRGLVLTAGGGGDSGGGLGGSGRGEEGVAPGNWLAICFTNEPLGLVTPCCFGSVGGGGLGAVWKPNCFLTGAGGGGGGGGGGARHPGGGGGGGGARHPDAGGAGGKGVTGETGLLGTNPKVKVLGAGGGGGGKLEAMG